MSLLFSLRYIRVFVHIEHTPYVVVSKVVILLSPRVGLRAPFQSGRLFNECFWHPPRLDVEVNRALFPMPKRKEVISFRFSSLANN
jgi:hypothetical protein